MTRKDALREAIHIVSNARIGKQRKADIIAGLELCQQELPFSHWSREAIAHLTPCWWYFAWATSASNFRGLKYFSSLLSVLKRNSPEPRNGLRFRGNAFNVLLSHCSWRP